MVDVINELKKARMHLRSHTPKPRSKLIGLIAVIALALGALPVSDLPVSAATTSVIVRESDPATDAAELLVAHLGGTVVEDLAVIGGFSAVVPDGSVPVLGSSPAVASVTPNAEVKLTFDEWGDGASDLAGFAPKDYGGSLYRIAETTGAKDAWSTGVTGQGVDVALIDSGVTPVPGLSSPGQIVFGPDLSFESQSDQFRHLDTSGHGTHMAGIIAGRDNDASQPYAGAMTDHFVGMAPDSRIVSLKVAGHDGATDVSQVIAAIDWVVQHRTDDGLNIRVINLSFGTDSTQSYVFDPLAYAVEQAWKAGIVVVVAAGNDGNGQALRNPAIDPFVIAVGSHEGNKPNAAKPSAVSDFSNCGTAARDVDILARGRSVLSLRTPGSSADDENPEATVVGRLFLGSGTSQSAAVVSGASALLLSARPDLTPDEVKALLVNTGTTVKQARGPCSAPALDVKGALATPAPATTTQISAPALGTGSLDASRGSDRLEHQGVVLGGERDIFGNPWDGVSWSNAAALGTTWSGGQWNGTAWSGVSWSGVSWSGVSWSGVSWSGVSWSNRSWNGVSWSGTTWSGTAWSGSGWSGDVWG